MSTRSFTQLGYIACPNPVWLFNSAVLLGVLTLACFTSDVTAQRGPTYLSAEGDGPERALFVDQQGTVQVEGVARFNGPVYLNANVLALQGGKPFLFFEPNIGGAFGIHAPHPAGDRYAFRIVDGATYAWQNLEPAFDALLHPSSSVSLGFPDRRWNFLYVNRIEASGHSEFRGDLQVLGNAKLRQLSIVSNGEDQFRVSASGDAQLRGSISVGGKLTCQVLEVTSDRNAKTAIEPVDAMGLLDRILDLPISAWRYQNDSGGRHIGPMAQDFYEAFNVGSDDKHISPLDAASVAIAGVQALAKEVRKRDEQLAARDKEVASLKQELDRLSVRLEQISRQLSATAPQAD